MLFVRDKAKLLCRRKHRLDINNYLLCYVHIFTTHKNNIKNLHLVQVHGVRDYISSGQEEMIKKGFEDYRQDST